MGTVTQGIQFKGGQQTSSGLVVCDGVNGGVAYVCETGHCCEETGCCTYYYELWWFWLLWTVVLLFSCCCGYRHRRAKLRLQRQQQRQQEINLMAYQRACSSTGPTHHLSVPATLKLPSYEEVATRPRTPPPPYSAAVILPGGALYGLTSSHSSGNCTSCSCDSCSLSYSTSFSAQVTDDTLTSEATTPIGETCMVVPFPGLCPSSTTQSDPSPPPPITMLPPLLQGVQFSQGEEDGEESCAAKDTNSLSKHTFIFFNSNRQERGSEEGPKEKCFRHRCLTGDSGIEVCSCHVRCEQGVDEETGDRGRGEEVELIHDSVDFLHQTLTDCRQYGHCSASERGEELRGTVETCNKRQAAPPPS